MTQSYSFCIEGVQVVPNSMIITLLDVHSIEKVMRSVKKIELKGDFWNFGIFVCSYGVFN